MMLPLRSPLPSLALAFLVTFHTATLRAGEPEPTLARAFAGHFLIGVALNTAQVDGRDRSAGEFAAKHFAAITPENAMKWSSVHPKADRYDFKAADAYLDFAVKNKLTVIGHVLVWHSQTPAWVFQGEDGKPLTREILLKRMREHIHTVVGRYKGKIKGWDVVNEALSDNGPDILRDSPWRQIIGDDYIDHAFHFAKEADPQAELYYNDYGLETKRKRSNCVALLQGMLKRGVPVSGAGTQSHFQLNHPSLDQVESTIVALSKLGLKVMVTELDVDVLPSRGAPGNADVNRSEEGAAGMNPYTAGLPDEIQDKLAARYAALFRIYLGHRNTVSRVTFWGLDDKYSWLNNFPIRGRTNHPLLFDRERKPKDAFFAILREAGRSDGRKEPGSAP